MILRNRPAAPFPLPHHQQVYPRPPPSHPLRRRRQGTAPGSPLEASLPVAFQVALQPALQAALAKLEGKIDDWRRFEWKNYNRALGDGSAVAFEPVPFPDGTLPSDTAKNPGQTRLIHPSQTPTPLTSLAAIDGPGRAELEAYGKGIGLAGCTLTRLVQCPGLGRTRRTSGEGRGRGRSAYGT
ncbi:hypothetical protein B0H14DRAFT_3868229 [Mycena olivaceomarginata]|nr:hypothetical protein B0H14DRAFT_3868229 [Mycena olivaceomarginata]